MSARYYLYFIPLLLAACSVSAPHIPMNPGSVDPGTSVTRGGKPQQLLGTGIALGQALPAITLVDRNLQTVSLADFKGEVSLISVAPSLDTAVCERQTHLLGEAGEELPAAVRRVTITRDLPFAQKRFAEHTGFDEILFLSDYREAEFGLATGLLVDEVRLLARAVIVTDRDGIVRYLQVVPEMGELPDMDRAYQAARGLLAN